jgi:hypothetical protein
MERGEKKEEERKEFATATVCFWGKGGRTWERHANSFKILMIQWLSGMSIEGCISNATKPFVRSNTLYAFGQRSQGARLINLYRMFASLLVDQRWLL